LLKVGFSASAAGAEALAVGLFSGGVPTPFADAEPRRPLILRAAAAPRFSDDDDGEGEILPALTNEGWLVVVGLGEKVGLDAKRVRRIGGDLFAEVADLGFASLTIALDLSPELAAELAYGMRLRAWRPAERYRSKPDADAIRTLVEVTMVTADPAAAERRFAHLAAVAAGVELARDLVVAPANELTPQAFADQVLALERMGLAVEVLDAQTLSKQGLNLLLAVGRGSVHPPCLAILRWRGGPAGGQPAVFVGKGITFDTGGISIKDAEEMAEMKGDMAGAAAVVGLMYALAARRAPVNAVGILALAENMPSGRASRAMSCGAIPVPPWKSSIPMPRGGWRWPMPWPMPPIRCLRT
jgi:leucyl aminopeptidase